MQSEKYGNKASEYKCGTRNNRNRDSISVIASIQTENVAYQLA